MKFRVNVALGEINRGRSGSMNAISDFFRSNVESFCENSFDLSEHCTYDTTWQGDNSTNSVFDLTNVSENDLQDSASVNHDNNNISISTVNNDETKPNDDTPNLNLQTYLVKWAMKHNITQVAVTDLLHTLHPLYPELPLDCRSLLQTPSHMIIKKIDDGEYIHIGLKAGLDQFFLKFSPSFPGNIVELSFNIDGLPIFHSKGTQLWPILGLVKNFHVTAPFAIGLYCGTSKPKPLNSFFEDFISEVTDLLSHGFYHNNTLYSVSIHSFVCDAPARAFIKCVKSHGGYSACEKCVEEGEYYKGRVVFPGIKSALRTDKSFREQFDERHHLGMSPLLQLLGIDMVTSFPIDYMHAVCLGVMKKLLNSWVGGSLSVRLSANSVRAISKRLESLKSFIPSEFNRKPRGLNELARWKATEFRMFVVYLGPTVIKDIVDLGVYEHFLLFHCGIVILLSNKHITNIGTELAGELLNVFVKHSKLIYGLEFLVYNVHSLSHLYKDVDVYGSLDNFSAFPFENYLGELKRLIRSPKKPLQQVFRRLKEKSFTDQLISFNNKDLKHLMQHVSGPVLCESNICKQFKKLMLNSFMFCINSHSVANSYSLTKDNIVVEIHNIILDSENSTFILGKQFLSYKSYYTYPFDSTDLNIYEVNNLSQVLESWSVNSIIAKCMLLPTSVDSSWVCFPLIHTL